MMNTNNAAPNKAKVTLEGDQDIVIERAFRAPARLVFQAWTEPQHIRRWWALRSIGAEMPICEADVRPGGSYRYVTRVNGEDHAFSGTYEEVTPHSRLVYTQIYEPMRAAGHADVTVTFEEQGGVTHMTTRERYPSAQVRQGVLESGMVEGFDETMRQLDELLATLT